MAASQPSLGLLFALCMHLTHAWLALHMKHFAHPRLCRSLQSRDEPGEALGLGCGTGTKALGRKREGEIKVVVVVAEFELASEAGLVGFRLRWALREAAQRQKAFSVPPAQLRAEEPLLTLLCTHVEEAEHGCQEAGFSRANWDYSRSWQ